MTNLQSSDKVKEFDAELLFNVFQKCVMKEWGIK